MIREILLVGLGSAIGGMLRFLAGKTATYFLQHPFPIGTFLVNLSGSFLIGLLYGIYSRTGSISSGALLFFATGICGGFTTFSAFSYENYNLLKTGNYLLAAIYITGSILLGLAAVVAGYLTGK